MAGKTTVRPSDKKINTKVTIKDSEGNVTSVDKVLLADSGASKTLVAWSNIKGGTWTLGPIGSVGGIGAGSFPFVELQGGTMEIETEAHAGGDIQMKSCGKIGAVFGEIDLGDGAHGFLGMDQFDEVKADPVKNAAGTGARMARRAP